MDRRGVLAQALMRRKGAKKTGKTIAFKCPRHSDGTASAWLGDHKWGCSACGFTEHFDTLAPELGVTLPEDTRKGLTLADYAERKGLSLETLRQAGVEERVGKYGDALVAMPYRDAEGKVIRTKMRTIKGTFWDRDGEGAPLYGQDVLARSVVTAPVIIVEGESDCHAGWQHGLCVVGLPGASQWRTEYTPLLAGREVYVWQEPDEGGATLVSAVAKDIPKARVIREVQLDGTPVKDLCDLHQRLDREAFAATWLPLWNTLCHGGGGGVGLARGWFVTIGANTGTGKSLMGLNLAHQAMLAGEAVTFLSLEMGRSELATRLMAITSGLPVVELEQGPGFNPATFETARRQLDAIRELSGGHVLVNRRPLSKLSDLIACIKYYHEVHGSRYVVVDYLQLAWTANSQSIHDRIELVAHQLRDLTHSLGITLVALSQFNRQTSAARSERPTAQGLMGGSAVENDSHQVLLFDHSRFERMGHTANTWLILDKNRHGGVADIPVQWDFRTLRLTPRAPTIEEQEDQHGRLTRYGRMR